MSTVTISAQQPPGPCSPASQGRACLRSGVAAHTSHVRCGDSVRPEAPAGAAVCCRLAEGDPRDKQRPAARRRSSALSLADVLLPTLVSLSQAAAAIPAPQGEAGAGACGDGASG